MFSWFKKLFSGKKKPVSEQPPAPQPQPVIEQPAPVEEKKPVDTIAGHRDRKVCPKCGAPNDDFVRTCWLCKSSI